MDYAHGKSVIYACKRFLRVNIIMPEEEEEEEERKKAGPDECCTLIYNILIMTNAQRRPIIW